MNALAVNLPAHLNENCLQLALEKAFEGHGIKLKTWQWQLANVSGGNFCSNIYRVNGSFEILPPGAHAASSERQFKLIIKDCIMEIAEVGTNELVMYERILPEMQRIFERTQREKQAVAVEKFAPSCFLAQSNQAHEFYVLEDLNALGFQSGNRFEGLEMAEAKVVLAKIASFHAVSMVYAKKFPDIIANLKLAHFANGAADPMAKSIVKHGMAYAKADLDDLDEELLKKMASLTKRFDEKVKPIVDPSKSVFNVLSHGDFWVNNILIKNDQTTSEAIFVDFQNVFWGSPALDLQYVLHTSLSLKTLQTERFALLLHYYKALKATLLSLEHDYIPSWCDLQKEMRRAALIGYYAALCEFPICCMSEADAQGFTADTFLDSGDDWKKIYKTQRVREFVRYAVLHFQEIGLFDE